MPTKGKEIRGMEFSFVPDFRYIKNVNTNKKIVVAVAILCCCCCFFENWTVKNENGRVTWNIYECVYTMRDSCVVPSNDPFIFHSDYSLSFTEISKIAQS